MKHTGVGLLLLLGACRCATPRAPAVEAAVTAPAPAPAVKPVQTAPPPPTEPAIEAALPPVPRATTAAEARAQREEFERRPPDARFLRAIEHLALLSAAAAVPPVEAKLRDGKWSLVQGPTTLATVAAWPGFKELLDPVVSRAGEARAAAAPAPGALPLLIGDALVGELDAVNALWSAGDRSPAFLGRAAHALVSAAFEIYDAMGIVDAVPARAIALAAMAKRAGALPTADEALLAELLGYEREARALAGPLPAGNPVRAYVLREDAALEARAGGKDSSLTDRYLWTRRLSALGDEGRSQSWMGELGPELQTPAFLEAFLRSGTFSGLGVGADLAQAELSAILARARIKPEDLATRPGAPADHPPRLAEMAELALAALPDARGVPFDVDLERAVARARIASAVDGMLRGQIARYSDPANAAGVLQFLGSAPPGPLRDVEAWVYSIVNRYKGRDGFNRLEKLLEVGLGSLGGEALARYLDQGAGGMPAQYGLLRLTRFVARRMDTRPSHRQALLGLLFARTFDRAWQERMARRQLEVLDAERTRGWLAMLDGDWATAERMASDPRRAPADRIADLWQLYEAGRLDAKAASKRMRAIADGAPDDYAATDKYEDFLEDLWRWEDMVSFLGPWVKRHAGEDTIQTAKKRANLARGLWEAGRAEEAWPLLQPAIEFGPQAALYEAGLVQLARGKREEALEFDRQIMERYPELGASSSVGILWRAGEYALAGKRLAEQGRHFRWNWTTARIFIACFRNRPFAEAENAVKAVPPHPHWTQTIDLVHGLVEHKRPDYAALWARSIALPATALNEIGDLYRVLRDGGPREAADAWLSERKLGPVDFEGTQRQYELGIDALTDDVPLTTDKIMAAPVRVTLQAIVLGRKRALSGAAFEALRAEAAMAEAVSDPAWQPARVLLGLDPPEALPAAPPKGTWAVAEPFARATLAESRGRYDEAVEGYMDTLDLLSFRRMEWEWARKRLEEFTKSGKSIQRLIREGL